MDLKQVNNYVIKHKLGSGAFGDVYLAVHCLTGKKVALKIESNQNRINHPKLETRIYEVLQGHIGIPKVYEYIKMNKYEVMVMEVLGPGLDVLYRKCLKKFTLKTVLMIADQLISNLEFIHSRNIIHRDVKPQNILVGRGEKINQLYFVDFGIAKRYRDLKTGEHIDYKDDKRFLGTVRFVSTNIHKGIEPSRRDDMESLGYVLIYLLKGKLPWENVRERNKYQIRRKIGYRKQMITTRDLCRGIPEEFVYFMDYVKKLSFAEKPDYQFLRSLLRGLFLRNDFKRDLHFDWMDGKVPAAEVDKLEESEVVADFNNKLKIVEVCRGGTDTDGVSGKLNSVDSSLKDNVVRSSPDLSSKLAVSKDWGLPVDNLGGEKGENNKKGNSCAKSESTAGKFKDTFSGKMSKIFFDEIREAATSYDKYSSIVATDGSEVDVILPEKVDFNEVLPEIVLIDPGRPKDDSSDGNNNVCDASTQENNGEDVKFNEDASEIVTAGAILNNVEELSGKIKLSSSCLDQKKSSNFWNVFQLFKMEYFYVFCVLYFLIDFVAMLRCKYF